MNRVRWAMASGLLALGLPSAAAAATPLSGYGGEGGNVQGDVSGSAGVLSGSLPFTGLGLFSMVLIAMALLATGVLLRRRAAIDKPKTLI